MRQCGDGDRLDVLGGDVVAAPDDGQRPGEQDEGERAPGGGPQAHRPVTAGRRRQGHAVAADGRIDPHRLDGLLRGEQVGGVGGPGHRLLLPTAGDAPVQDGPLLLGVGVAEGQPREEAVELGLGQLVGALVLDGVRRGDDVEGAGQGEGRALDGDLPLLHRLQERGLGLGRGPVDLVGQQQVGEQRPLAEAELLAARVEEEGAGQVAGEQVRRELGPGEFEAERLREGAGGQGLAQPGEVLQEDVAAGEDGGEHEFELFALAHDRPLHGGQDLP